jgi:hypothetical protein
LPQNKETGEHKETKHASDGLLADVVGEVTGSGQQDEKPGDASYAAVLASPSPLPCGSHDSHPEPALPPPEAEVQKPGATKIEVECAKAKAMIQRNNDRSTIKKHIQKKLRNLTGEAREWSRESLWGYILKNWLEKLLDREAKDGNSFRMKFPDHFDEQKEVQWLQNAFRHELGAARPEHEDCDEDDDDDDDDNGSSGDEDAKDDGDDDEELPPTEEKGCATPTKPADSGAEPESSDQHDDQHAGEPSSPGHAAEHVYSRVVCVDYTVAGARRNPVPAPEYVTDANGYTVKVTRRRFVWDEKGRVVLWPPVGEVPLPGGRELLGVVKRGAGNDGRDGEKGGKRARL